MKNKFLVLGMTALLTFVLVLTGCGDSPKGTPTPPPPAGKDYSLLATADGGSAGKQILNIDMTGDSARAVDSGDYDYKVMLGGIVISEGTVNVNGNLYTFTPSEGSAFTYNKATGATTGKITISQKAKDEIETASGMVLALPDTLTIEEVQEARVSSGKWDGTWSRREDFGSDVKTGQKIVLSGNKYTLTQTDGKTETGTFIYTNEFEGDTDFLFIFFRSNVTSGFKVAAYLWEGTVNDPDDPDENWLELYNNFEDTLKISALGSTGREFRKE